MEYHSVILEQRVITLINSLSVTQPLTVNHNEFSRSNEQRRRGRDSRSSGWDEHLLTAIPGFSLDPGELCCMFVSHLVIFVLVILSPTYFLLDYFEKITKIKAKIKG
ncbi:hypothetical protein ATANTOWER_026788 [Ataeniobius toweri]|uniref:Uncharacterized protein n=1 Tax=Ataeniobius toweri TaxID=208326 RepID=A0ABU7AH50_9TELE|nr:hypothetical protein [Ataeniobius toweri]